MSERLPHLLGIVATRLQATRPLVALDLETTGVNAELDRIVEITLARYEPASFNTDTFEARINPGVPIPMEASAVHGITDDVVRECSKFSAVAARVFALLDGADLIGFNHRRFDVRLLVAELARCGLPNPMANARTVDVGLIFMKQEPRTLEAAVRFFCDRTHEGAHGTTADVVATLEVLLAQLDRYPELAPTIEVLDQVGRDASFIDREGKVVWKGGEACINVGAQRGTPLRHVDRGFLRWILGRDFPEDTKAIVRAALNGEYPVPPEQPVAAGS